MNDHKKKKLCFQTGCVPEKLMFHLKIRSILTKVRISFICACKMRFYEGKDGKFSATPSLKLFYTLLYIVLTACSGNYLFTLIMCAAVTVRLAFFRQKLSVRS